MTYENEWGIKKSTTIASWWELFLARIFGKKVSDVSHPRLPGQTTTYELRGYVWRGTLYITKYGRLLP